MTNYVKITCAYVSIYYVCEVFFLIQKIICSSSETGTHFPHKLIIGYFSLSIFETLHFYNNGDQPKR